MSGGAARSGGGVLWDSTGRLRLGWRLLLWLLAVAALASVTAVVLPSRGLPWVSLPTLVAGVGAGLALLAYEGRPLGELGFPLDRAAFAGAGKGTALGVGVGLAAVAAIAAAGGVRWTGDGGSLTGWLATGAAAAWALAIPAAAEEALVRGYPLRALARALGDGPALVLTSGVFALLHAANPDVGTLALVNVGVAGLFLGAVALRTGSLWWASGAHLGWNWSHAFLADLPVSGFEMVDAPLLEPVASGPAWVGGGAFGPEGSVLAMVVLGAAAAWAWRSRRLRPRSGVDGEDRRGATGVL